jgi:hypothetical protein
MKKNKICTISCHLGYVLILFLKLKKNVSYQKLIMKTKIKSSMLASLGKKILFHHIDQYEII